MIAASQSRRTRAFSLLEVLVALAVFCLMVLLFLQMTTSATDLAGNGQRRMNALVDSRTALDRLSLDLDRRVRDAQAPLRAVKQSGNDSLSFYADTVMNTTSRPVTLVTYRINDNSIERSSEGTKWNAGDVAYAPSSPPAAASTSFDDLSEAVFRLECSFLMKDGQTLVASAPSDWSKVAAVLVGVAVMDRKEMALLSAGQISSMAGEFPDAVDGEPILTTWKDVIPKLDDLVPMRAARTVRIYQRSYPIN